MCSVPPSHWSSFEIYEIQLVTGWNSEAVYRALLQLPVFRDPEANQAELAKLHPKLALTIEETSHHRQRLSKLRKKLHRPLRSTPPSRISVPPPVLTQGPKSKSVKQGAGKTAKAAVLGSNPESHQSAPTRWHPLQPGNCPRCSDLPMEQQCIRLLEVEARDCSHLVGSALTCFPPDQRLHPKPKVRFCSIQTSYVLMSVNAAQNSQRCKIQAQGQATAQV
jgi:hypothetical protein